MKKQQTNNQLSVDIAIIGNKVENIEATVTEIKSKVESVEKYIPKAVVRDDSEYKEMKSKVDSLWDSHNKLVGWMLGAGVAGGSVATVLSGIVKVIQAAVK